MQQSVHVHSLGMCNGPSMSIPILLKPINTNPVHLKKFLEYTVH